MSSANRNTVRFFKARFNFDESVRIKHDGIDTFGIVQVRVIGHYLNAELAHKKQNPNEYRVMFPDEDHTVINIHEDRLVKISIPALYSYEQIIHFMKTEWPT